MITVVWTLYVHDCDINIGTEHHLLTQWFFCQGTKIRLANIVCHPDIRIAFLRILRPFYIPIVNVSVLPVYFFFSLNTAHLTDVPQMLNLDELARVAKKYGLSVRFTGAADSSTGTPGINDSLSVSRAGFIATELIRRGISDEHITRTGRGGIADHTPTEANRHTKVELFFSEAK